MIQIRHNHILPSRPQTDDQPIREKISPNLCSEVVSKCYPTECRLGTREIKSPVATSKYIT